MKIKVAKNYGFDQTIYKSDLNFYYDHTGGYCGLEKTYKSDYSSIWDKEDVTIEQLQDYINKGYAIKINC